ncbi:MAG: Pr6Pr family membrane protein, partial [Clostridia bacterium]|nr:Pr6Pr family membrane protein [Clostridia bacterium]
MELFYELSFLGNIFTGVFLFVIAIVWIFNKQIPQYIILDFTVLMLLILGVEVVTQDFYFKDGWAFVHFVNPVLMFVFYLFASNQKNVKWYLSFTALVLPIIYMIFAFIFGACTGDYIYDFLDFNEFGVGNTVLFIFGTAAGLSAISVGIHFLN